MQLRRGLHHIIEQGGFWVTLGDTIECAWNAAIKFRSGKQRLVDACAHVLKSTTDDEMWRLPDGLNLSITLSQK
jgi:hypothetical protein